MRVRRWLLGGFGAFALCALACTETPYQFFPQSGPGPSSGGAQGSGTGGLTGGSGGVPAGAGGALGMGGDLAASDCQSVLEPTRTAYQLQTSSGRCVSLGEYAPLLGEVAFAVVIDECTGALGQRWTMEAMEYGAIVFSSEGVVLNLDVRFAASDDGTPVVLYTPHRLYNQRFVQITAEDGTFTLSPLHAQTKCLSERGNGLELWPCDAAATDQTFELIACDAGSAESE